MLRFQRTVLFALLIFCGQKHLFAQQGAIDDAQKLLDQAQSVVDQAQRHQQRADSIFNNLTKVAGPQVVKLPLAIPVHKNISAPGAPESPYEITLYSLKMDAYSALADVYLKLDRSVFSPGANNSASPIYFAAGDIRFTKNGGFTGDARLFLINDFEIQLGNGTKLKVFAINPSNKSVTNVLFDCNGFQQMHLSAALSIESSIAVREDANGKKTTEPLEIFFETDISDLNGWLFEINNIPAFQFTFLPDFSWSVTSLVYDNSTSVNSEAMAMLPEGYDLDVAEPEMWRGFYLKKATVSMPTYLKPKSAEKGERTKIVARSLLIDNNGFNGDFSAQNVFPKGDGSMGAWNYDIQEISAKVRESSLAGFGMAGNIDMPMAKKKEINGEEKYAFGYRGEIFAGTDGYRLRLTASNYNDIDFDLFRVARVEDLVASLEIESAQNDLQASLIMSCKITTAPSTKPDVTKPTQEDLDGSPSLITVTIEQLKLQSRPPYFDLKAAKLERSSSLARLPVTLEGVRVDKVAEDKVALTLSLNVNLMEGASGIAGGADVVIYAKNEANHWEYDKSTIGKICLMAQGGSAYSVTGCVQHFQDDPDYGTGYQGNLSAKFIGGKMEVQAMAVFGKTLPEQGDYRYWFIDAGVKFPVAIPIFTGVGINGFYGGAYYHMTLKPPSEQHPTRNCAEGNAIGCNANGAQFFPKGDEGLGIRAGLSVCSSPSQNAFEGKLVFGVQFATDGHVSKVSFEGYVTFLSKVQQDQAIRDAAKNSDKNTPVADPGECTKLTAQWLIVYNLDESILSGNFEVLMDLGFVKGIYPKCSTGKSEIYFSPKKWYVYLGKPDNGQRLGFNFVNLFTVETYLVMGSELPRPPIAPLPEGFDNGGGIPNLANTGGGFGFGLRGGAEVNMRKSAKVIGCEVYGEVRAGFQAGFDILIAKDQPAVNCSNGERGHQNWYATGQAFLKAWGSVGGGAKCKFGGVDVKFIYLNVKIYAIAQLPNPTYMWGTADAELEILGVGGSLSMPFKFGNPCREDEDPSKGISVIDRVFPKVREETVSAYSLPRMTLTKTIGSEFHVNGTNPNQVTNKTISLQYAYVTALTKLVPNGNTETRVAVAGYSSTPTAPCDPTTSSCSTFPYTVVSDVSGYTISFIPKKALEAGVYEAKMGVHFSDGKNDEVLVQFGVSPEDNTIPLDNIQYAYPLPNMKNFYRLTGKQGYIRLRSLPSAPVEEIAGRVYAVKFYDGDKLVTTEKVSFNKTPGDNQSHFTYAIPASLLENAKPYRLKVVRTQQTVFTSPSAADSKGLVSGNSSGQGSLEDNTLMEYDFTTSAFSSFEEKMAAFVTTDAEKSGSSYIIPLLNKSESGASFGTEGFTSAELNGYLPREGEQQPPSVQFTAVPASLGGFVGANHSYSRPDNRAEPQAYPFYDAIKVEEGAKGYEIRYEVPFYIAQSLTNTSANDGLVGQPIIKIGNNPVKVDYYLPGKQSVESSYSINFTIPQSAAITYTR